MLSEAGRYRMPPPATCDRRESQNGRAAHLAARTRTRAAAAARAARRLLRRFDEEIGRIAPAGGSAIDRQKALARGRLVHRLMQSLPDIPPERRQDAADRYLAKAAARFCCRGAGGDRPPGPCHSRATRVSRAFFAAGSRAELPIVGHIRSRRRRAGRGISGKWIGSHRRGCGPDRRLQIDRAVPARLAKSRALCGAACLYRAVLSRLYPDKTVRAALLFTSRTASDRIARSRRWMPRWPRS